jgi:hypothetical protein
MKGGTQERRDPHVVGHDPRHRHASLMGSAQERRDIRRAMTLSILA